MNTAITMPEDCTLSATYRFGGELTCIDEGFAGDPVWAVVESLGVVALVVADKWETAYEVAQDLVYADADPDDPFNYATSYDETAQEGELAEGVGYRPNGVPSDDNPRGLTSYLYAEDINGSRIMPLTDALVKEWGLLLTFSEEEA